MVRITNVDWKQENQKVRRRTSPSFNDTMKTMIPLEERSIDSDVDVGLARSTPINNRETDKYNNDDDDDDLDLSSEDSSKTMTKKNAKNDCEVEKLTLKDTRIMMVWKVVVFALILMGAAVVGAGTYFFVQKTETEEFEHTYEQFVDTIREALMFHIRGVTGSTQSQANFLIAEAAARNQTFPTVTIVTFEVEGLSVRVGSRVQGTIFTPLLESTQDVLHWNTYSTQEQSWIQTSVQEFQASPEYLPTDEGGGLRFDDKIVSYVHDGGLMTPLTRIPTTMAPAAPWWQSSPPLLDPASTINLDLMSVPEVHELYQAVREAREGLFGPIKPEGLDVFTDAFVKTKPFGDLRKGNYLYGEKSADLRTHRRLEQDNDQEDDEYHPASLFMQPVFADKYDPQSKIVGLIHTIVQWDAYVVSLLPPGEEGLRVVLSNNCGQVYTYEINGPNVRIGLMIRGARFTSTSRTLTGISLSLSLSNKSGGIHGRRLTSRGKVRKQAF